MPLTVDRSDQWYMVFLLLPPQKKCAMTWALYNPLTQFYHPLLKMKTVFAIQIKMICVLDNCDQPSIRFVYLNCGLAYKIVWRNIEEADCLVWVRPSCSFPLVIRLTYVEILCISTSQFAVNLCNLVNGINRQAECLTALELFKHKLCDIVAAHRCWQLEFVYMMSTNCPKA